MGCLLLILGSVTAGCAGHKPSVSAPPALRNPRPVEARKGVIPPLDPTTRLQLAEQYTRSGDTTAAIEQLAVVRETGGDDDTLDTKLASLYDAIGEPEPAASVLAAGLAKHPVSSALSLTYSRELLKLGDFGRASVAIHPLIAQWQVQPDEVRRAVTRTVLLAGEAEQAVTLIPTDCSDADWLGLKGLYLLLVGQAKSAASMLDRAVVANPQQGRNVFLRGEAWLAAGDVTRALDAWQTAASLPGAPPQAAIGAARLLVQMKRYDEAAMLIQRIGDTARSLPAYWQVQEALARKGGQPVFAQIARGYAAYHSGDPWQAETIWRAALPRASKDDAWALWMALINSAEQRQDRVSLPYATAAANRFPHDYYILKKRADLLLGQNARAEALAVAEPLSSIEPPEQAGQAADLVARIALKLGSVELLQRTVQRERELAPRDPSPLLHLIEWQRRQSWTAANMDNSLKLCQEAISLAPDNAEAYFRAGEVLKSMGRAEEAMTMLRHALTLAPRLHDGSPNALLSQLEQRQGLLAESRYELSEVKRLNELRDPWPTQMELLYRERPAPTLGEWKTLGKLALDRHEPWVALCAATRAIRMAPSDPAPLHLRAAALSRLGRADEALAAMRAAHILQRAK